MADERPVVNVTPGNPIKSQAELDSQMVQSTREPVFPGENPSKPRFPGDNPNAEADRQEMMNQLQEIADPRGERFADHEMSEEEAAARAKIAEFLKLPMEERIARTAVVLDRGIVQDRLKVDCPPDLHYEWVRNDPLEIDRMRTLGYWVDEVYASRRAIHSDGTSGNQVADVICMMTMKENREMIDRVYLEKQLKATRRPKKAQEDEEFESATARATEGIIPTFSESNQRTVTAADVRAALARANGQTQVQR